VDDAIAIALVRRTDVVFGFLAIAAAGFRAARRARNERLGLDALEHLANVHGAGS